uniref:DNA repair protein SWI5 homolog n=2 Tax=Canis lupus familiaris TaxID=9615 RepID=A0A8I3PZ72_CANLF
KLRAQPLAPPTSGRGRDLALQVARASSHPAVGVSVLRFRVPGGPEGPLSRPALDPSALHTPPRRGPRTPGLRRTQPGLSQSCRGAFQSPRPSPKSGQADGASKDSLRLDIQKLKEKRDLLDKEITQLISEGYSVDELEDHISQLHEYNDIKDIGQMLLGKLAMIRGVTTKELYPEFGLEMND